ncbi:endonuclease III domain-containing protein [Azospirillum argentinense]
MQQVIASFGDGYRFLDLPDPDEWLLPGVRWGRHEHPLTPAFWSAAAWMEGEVPDHGFRLGGTLAEEVSACILGGHGLPAEVGLAAFARVRNELREAPDEVLPEDDLLRLLSAPLIVKGRAVRYRFARQRSSYLAAALRGLHGVNESALDDVGFRDALLALPGIGPKTASWIVRNRRGSDKVAILDVHVVRACRVMGVFPENADPTRRYAELEQRFLQFCMRAHARASVMDAVMWDTMRRISTSFLNFLVDPGSVLQDVKHRPRREQTRCREAGEDEGMATSAAEAMDNPIPA